MSCQPAQDGSTGALAAIVNRILAPAETQSTQREYKEFSAAQRLSAMLSSIRLAGINRNRPRSVDPAPLDPFLRMGDPASDEPIKLVSCNWSRGAGRTGADRQDAEIGQPVLT